MVLRHALLALLALSPRSGYELTKTLRGSLSHVWTANHSQVYPELRRLLKDGLIREVGGVGPRGRRVYEPTAAGRASVVAWLGTVPSRESRNESVLRIWFLGLLPRERALAYLRAEASFRRGQLEAYEATMAEGSTPLRWSYVALEWGIRYSRAIVDWLEWTADQLESGALDADVRQPHAHGRSQARSAACRD